VECEAAGVRIHYEERGTGRPVIALHGWSLDHTETVFELDSHFSERPGWRRIYLDLPGSGKTPRADWIQGSDQMLELVLAFLRKVIPGERFVAIGTSYGAYLVRGLVLKRGSDMDGAMFSVPVILADTKRRTVPARTVLARDEAFVEAARKEGLDWIEDVGTALVPALHDYARALQPTSPVDTGFLDEVRKKYEFSFDVDHLESPFLAPTLFLMGRQDNVVGYRDSWNVLENYPRATFAVLDHAGHLLWGERAQLASALTSDWLDRVEEWTAFRTRGRNTRDVVAPTAQPS